MGVNDGVVIPRLRRAQTRLVQFANGNNGVLVLAGNLVATDIEVVGKAVVLPNSLLPKLLGKSNPTQTVVTR